MENKYLVLKVEGSDRLEKPTLLLTLMKNYIYNLPFREKQKRYVYLKGCDYPIEFTEDVTIEFNGVEKFSLTAVHDIVHTGDGKGNPVVEFNVWDSEKNEFKVFKNDDEIEIHDYKCSIVSKVGDIYAIFPKKTYSYNSYIYSVEWEARKRLLFKAPVCIVCGTNKDIDIHHITYENLGHETSKDLCPLCRKHHTDVHSMQNEYFEMGNAFDLAKAVKSLGPIVAKNDDSIADMIIKTLGLPNPTHSDYKILKDNFIK